jgi:transposase
MAENLKTLATFTTPIEADIVRNRLEAAGVQAFLGDEQTVGWLWHLGTALHGVKVLVATKPVDFRKGADGLAALVREALGHDPFSETIFIFRSKRADRLKILASDGSGLILFWKRLEHGAFRWPPGSDGVMRLTGPQLAALVGGMEWSRLHARDVARPTATS